MIYEYNGKFYVRPFSNKIVEVEINKKDNEYDVVATTKVVMLTPQVQKEMVEVTLEYAYNKMHGGKSTKSSLSVI